MSKAYSHIIFDLDHTLWDFERNATETLTELFDKHQLHQLGMDLNHFTQTYTSANEELWNLFNKGMISHTELRANRFELVFEKMGFAKSHVPVGIGEDFIERCPQKTHLMPYTKDILDYLLPKYTLHIITNGFPDTQSVKLKSSGILHYFQEIVTSGQANCKKPDKQIFMYLIEKLQVTAHNCLMIGDSLEADVEGALNVNMDVVFYNPNRAVHQHSPTYEVSCLSDLKYFL